LNASKLSLPARFFVRETYRLAGHCHGMNSAHPETNWDYLGVRAGNRDQKLSPTAARIARRETLLKYHTKSSLAAATDPIVFTQPLAIGPFAGSGSGLTGMTFGAPDLADDDLPKRIGSRRRYVDLALAAEIRI
jgi:hypothetical protein